MYSLARKGQLVEVNPTGAGAETASYRCSIFDSDGGALVVLEMEDDYRTNDDPQPGRAWSATGSPRAASASGRC